MSAIARVYRNLNTGLWSIKQRIDGKWIVVGHAQEVGLGVTTPVISEKRFDHVRNGNHREVFAYLEGPLEYVSGFEPFRGREPVLAESQQTTWDEDDREEVLFKPFAQVRRGFYWASMDDDFEYCHSAYFSADHRVWGYV